MRILIVDDDASVRKFLKTILTTKGYEVETAPEGLEAIDKVQKDNFDLVLLDIRMPIIGGWELKKRIEAISPSTIIVCMSGYDQPGCLVKPLDMDNLIRLLKDNEARLSA